MGIAAPEIAARRFPAQGEPWANLLIAGAMGVRQDFYEPLARYLAAQGYLPTVLPVLLPIYLAAFIAEYGADRERRGIVATMRDLLSAALARRELAPGSR